MQLRLCYEPDFSECRSFGYFVKILEFGAQNIIATLTQPSPFSFPVIQCQCTLCDKILIDTAWHLYCLASMWKPRQNDIKTTSFRGAMGRHGQTGSGRGQWTGGIGSTPVQISGCGLDGALSWCGQGEGQSLLVSSWAACAVAAAPSFQTCFACVHMYILYACVYICVCAYVCGHDICIYMHVCMYLYFFEDQY